MLKYILIGIVLLIIAIAISLYVISKNRFKIKLIRINESIKQITELLKEKYDALNTVNSIIKEKTGEDFLKNLDEVKIDELSIFDLQYELAKYDVDIIELTEFNKDIKLDADDVVELDKLTKVNIDCGAAVEYYNDNVETYNDYINRFPYSVVAKMNKHKKKEMFESQKEEMFEILKQ